MICGYQVACGGWDRPMAFCAERKGDGLPLCAEHYEDVLAEYGEVRMAPGNALGERHWQTRLLWEGDDPAEPAEASAEEIALYAAILGSA
jgi:hypothetical protein